MRLQNDSQIPSCTVQFGQAKQESAPMRLIRVSSGKFKKPGLEANMPNGCFCEPYSIPSSNGVTLQELSAKKKNGSKFPYDVFSTRPVLKSVKSAGAQIAQRPIFHKAVNIQNKYNLQSNQNTQSTFELLATNTILHDMEKLKSECSKILQTHLSEQTLSGFLPEIRVKSNEIKGSSNMPNYAARITSAGIQHFGPINIPPPRVTINMNNEFYFNGTGQTMHNSRIQKNCNSRGSDYPKKCESRPDSKGKEDMMNQTGHFFADEVQKAQMKQKLIPVSAPPKKDLIRRIQREKICLQTPIDSPNNPCKMITQLNIQKTQPPTVVYLRKYKRKSSKIEEKRDPVLNITFGIGQCEETPQSEKK